MDQPTSPGRRTRVHERGQAATDEADRIAQDVAEDERLASEARDRHPGPDVVDERLKQHVHAGETVYAVRERVLVEGPAIDPETMFGGSLFVTERRLVVRGPLRTLEIDLDQIVEMAAVGSRVLQIDLATGLGVALQVERPRLLRVQIQAARRLA